MMKIIYLLVIGLMTSFSSDLENREELDLNVLIGEWTLDMSPQDKTDANFTQMKITKVTDYSFKGEFYREGVKIRNANINTQMGIIYGALVSGDNSGEYHTTFYYEDGVLHGTTHSVSRDFLAVWTATKDEE
ncbi:MAG: hypothetical protein AAGG68_24305 [Bacteroidota bacterium]